LYVTGLLNLCCSSIVSSPVVQFVLETVLMPLGI
jgi:hypothetical protein